MSHFSDHYEFLTYPSAMNGKGLYNAQAGAIHSIASHFTVDERPAIVTMPTGSGKTAVLMMTPYVLKSNRILVITPSKLVRNQICEEFSSLQTLLETGVFPEGTPPPNVFELGSRVRSPEEWESLREYDVVVSTPNCTSPGYHDVPAPPADLFDLLLIDEAHHTPARTWTELLSAFPTKRRVLFTATPFRRDKSEIHGRFIYSYPIARAYSDRIFGTIKYVPVNIVGHESSDRAIAQRTQEAFQTDRDNGLRHKVMVRTDSLKRAEELDGLYRDHTSLRLALIHSRLSNRTVKGILKRLEEDELDGIVCVNMLGEGFNFPRLKIAAIHAPHRSLEVTLQFIGRFARTNASDIGDAKFIAVLSDIEIDSQRLFEEGAIWQKLIPDLSHGRIAREIKIREALQTYSQLSATDAHVADLSLYSLSPRSHVKIYDIPVDVDFSLARFQFASDTELSYSALNEARDVLLLITRKRASPKWSSGDTFLDNTNDLIVLFYDKDTHLLFINSSRSIEGVYEAIAQVLSPGAKPVPISLVRRVVRGIANQRLFNVGMRNIQATNKAESYKILAGSDTSTVITPADARRYRQGHVYLLGEQDGNRVTIGYSSGGKVWSATNLQIPELVDWCRGLGRKIRSAASIVTHSGLDYLDAGTIAEIIPARIIYVQWNRSAYDFDPPTRVKYRGDDQAVREGQILDLELDIDRNQSSSSRIRVMVRGEGLSIVLDFSLDEFYTAPNSDDDRVTVLRGSHSCSLLEYVNETYLDFFTADGGVLNGNELFEPKQPAQPIDLNQIEVWDWSGIDITSEVANTPGGLSVQNRVRQHLAAAGTGLAYCDHGSGEIADFVTLTESHESVEIGFYHCKASGAASPGHRVDDVYEVSSQAQKSVAWTNFSRFENRVRRRRSTIQFIRGTELELDRLIESAKEKRRVFTVYVVQPGISKNELSSAMSESLGATNSHLVGAGALPLRVIASA